MEQTKPDWLKIKMEYIQGEKSYRELVEEFGLSKTAIAEKSQKESWIKQKENFQTEVEQELHEKLKNKRIQTLSEAIQISSHLLQKAKEYLPILDMQVVEHPKIVLDMFQQGFNILTDLLGITPEYVNEIRNKKYEPEISTDMPSEEAIKLIDKQILELQDYKKDFERLERETKGVEELKQETSAITN